ncbi:MAG: Hpt domain-containing protein [Azonexus sp.]|jgi:HPt (histidine-containing phosphotransfer) domain-containing protein|nr:Hpt domain-containing protein [Azonexus sp.]
MTPLTSAADEARTVVDALRQLPGFDVSVGLNLLRNRCDKYLHLLTMFLEHHGGDIDLLRRQIAAGQRADARLLAHSLKGVAGSIGATALHHDAAAFETAIKEDADPATQESLLTALAASHAALVAGLRRHLRPPTPPSAAVDWPALRQLLDTLATQLETDEMAAYDRCAEDGGKIREALGKPGERLVEAIETFAFAEAQAALAAIRRAFPQLA